MPKNLNELIDEVRGAGGSHAKIAGLVAGIAVLIAQAGTYPETLHALTTELSERANDVADAIAGDEPSEAVDEQDESEFKNDDPGFIDPATGHLAASPEDRPTPDEPAPLESASNDDMAQLNDPAVNTSVPAVPGLQPAPADNITGTDSD